MKTDELIEALGQLKVQTGSLTCLGCGHEVMLPRSKAEKNIRKVFRDGDQVSV